MTLVPVVVARSIKSVVGLDKPKNTEGVYTVLKSLILSQLSTKNG
jgi:hypothetical protein